MGFHRNCSSHDTRDQPGHGNVLGHLEVERDGDHGELISSFNSFWAPRHYFLDTMFKLQSLLQTFLTVPWCWNSRICSVIRETAGRAGAQQFRTNPRGQISNRNHVLACSLLAKKKKGRENVNANEIWE